MSKLMTDILGEDGKPLIDLSKTTNARVWAEEFKRTYPESNIDTDKLTTWFHSSLATGRELSK